MGIQRLVLGLTSGVAKNRRILKPMQLDNNLIRILTSFSEQNTYGFTELAQRLHYDTDLTGYYLRKLERKGLVVKVDRGVYRITPFGKSVLAQAHQFSDISERPRVTALLVAQYKDQYLMVKRTKQPFMNVIEFPVLPIGRGEQLVNGISRALKDRLGIVLSANPKGFFRRIDIYDETVFDDKFFAVFTAELTVNHVPKLFNKNDQGEISLKSKDTLTQEKISKGLLDLIEFTQSTNNFVEKTYNLSKPDLYA